ncbi:MAG: tetratricopeptide repeat protein [Symploca sp. SIO2C1]|nr:tetratricopeptide repeat protein [Symploca sp. SIO2C1]
MNFVFFSDVRVGIVRASEANGSTAMQMAQQPEATLQNPNRAAAEQVFAEGMQLYQQGTAESLQQAIAKLEESLPLWRVVGDKAEEGKTLNLIGSIYSNLGEKQQALEYYNQALPLRRTVGDKVGEAITLNNLGSYYHDLGEKQQALEYYNQSLPLFRAVGDKAGEAIILNNIGSFYDDLGEKQQALEYYNQSLPLRRAVGDKGGEARTLNNIGKVYSDLGEKQQALEYYNQSLPLFRVVGNKGGEARTINNIGRVHSDLGEKQQALEYYNQSLPLFRAIGDKAGEAGILNNLGNVYDDLAEKQQALEYYNQSLPLFRAIGDKTGEAVILNNLGTVYDALGKKEQALEYYNQSLFLRRTVGDKTGEAVTLTNIAWVKREQGNLTEALTQIEKAVEIIESLRTKIASPELRTSYFATQQDVYELYIELLMQLHSSNPSQGYDAKALHASERSRARSLLELLIEANADIRQGVEPQLVEQERTLQQKLNITEKRRVELLSGNHIPQQATTIEKEREQLLSQYQQIKAQIRATSPRYAALTQPQPLTLTEIQQQVLDEDTLLLQYSLGRERSYLWAVTKTSLHSYQLPPQADIETAAKQFYELLSTPGFQLEDTRGSIQVEKLKPTKAVNQLSQMLLAPVAAQLGDKRLLIVSDGALQYIPFSALPLPGEGNLQWLSINKAEGRRQEAEPTPNPSLEGNRREEDLTKVSTLIAHYSLLITQKSYPPLPETSSEEVIPLLVNNEIVHLPSATTLGIIRQEQATRQTAPKAIAILADPVFSNEDERFETREQGAGSRENEQLLNRSAREVDIGVWQRLPGTRTEAEAIMALVPDSERVHGFDFAANREMVTNPELSNYRIIHLATHGLLNSTNPELSGIVLSLFNEQGIPQNGFLRLHDVFNLNLPAELVVLSACQTGLGQEVKGEGLVGLTRGFMYAGSPRVLVSLWNVSDEATAEMMSRFYRLVLQEGLSATAALRAAQLEMQQETQWNAPYYWAAFTLQGEWK